MPSLLSAQPPSVRPPSAVRGTAFSTIISPRHNATTPHLLPPPHGIIRALSSSSTCEERPRRLLPTRIKQPARSPLIPSVQRSGLWETRSPYYPPRPTMPRIATRRFVDSPRHHDVPIITRHHSLSSEAEGPLRLRRRRAVLCRE